MLIKKKTLLTIGMKQMGITGSLNTICSHCVTEKHASKTGTLERKREALPAHVLSRTLLSKYSANDSRSIAMADRTLVGVPVTGPTNVCVVGASPPNAFWCFENCDDLFVFC